MPLDRPREPAVVASVLASEGSARINGDEIRIAGGPLS